MAERVLMLIDGHSLVYRGFYALQEHATVHQRQRRVDDGRLRLHQHAAEGVRGPEAAVRRGCVRHEPADVPAERFRRHTRARAPPRRPGCATRSRGAAACSKRCRSRCSRSRATRPTTCSARCRSRPSQQGLQRHHPERRQRPAAAGQSTRQSPDLAPRHHRHHPVRRGQGHREVRWPATRPAARLQGHCAATPPTTSRRVAGIGDKGAQKLLLEFGSVEALYDNLDSEDPAQAARPARARCATRCCWPSGWRRSSPICPSSSTWKRRACATCGGLK